MKIQILFLIVFLFVIFSVNQKKDTDIEEITSIIQDFPEDYEQSIQVVEEKFSWKEFSFKILAIVLLVLCLLSIFSVIKLYVSTLSLFISNKNQLEELFNKLGFTIKNKEKVSELGQQQMNDNLFYNITDKKKLFHALEEQLLLHDETGKKNNLLRTTAENNENENEDLIIQEISHAISQPIRIFYSENLFGKKYKEPIYSNIYANHGFRVWFKSDASMSKYLANKKLAEELIKISPDSDLLKNSQKFYNQNSSDKVRFSSDGASIRSINLNLLFKHYDEIYKGWLKTIKYTPEIENIYTQQQRGTKVNPNDEIKNKLIKYRPNFDDDIILFAEVNDQNSILNFKSNSQIESEKDTPQSQSLIPFNFDQNLLFEYDELTQKIQTINKNYGIDYYIKIEEKDFLNLYYDNESETYTSLNKKKKMFFFV